MSVVDELIEARETLGGGLVASAAPPHKEKLRWYDDYLRRQLEKNRVKITTGERTTADLIAARKPDRSGAAYQASKAGVLALTHAIMEEEWQNGIRATAILPGMTDTPLLDKRPEPASTSSGDAANREGSHETTPSPPPRASGDD